MVPQHVVCSMPSLLGPFLTFLALFPLHYSLPFEIAASAGRPTLAAGSHASQTAGDVISAGALASQDLKLGTSFAHNAPPPQLETILPGEPHPDHLRTTFTPGSSGPSTPSTSSRGSTDTFSPSGSSASSTHDQSTFSKSRKSFSPSSIAGDQEGLVTQPLSVHSSPETTAAHGINDAGLIVHHPAVENPNTYLSLLHSYWNRVGEYNPMGYFITRLELDPKDATELNMLLKLTSHRLNTQDKRVLNEYYKALSAANKKSTATVHFNPETFQLLSEWENTPGNSLITRPLFGEFFGKILPHQEAERRIRVFHLQRDQFRILSDWDTGITSMAKQIPASSEEEVRAFGEALGGKSFVPPLDKTGATERLNALKDLKKKAPQVAKSWREYMGPEYRSRVKLLEALAEMEHPLEGISADTIEAWRAQDLDVKRMLMIIDYRPKQVQPAVLSDGQQGLRFLSVDEFDYARKLYFRQTRDGIPWDKSLEHQQLLEHSSPEIRQRYLDLEPKIKNPVSDTAPPHLQPPKDPEPIPTPETIPIPEATRPGFSFFRKPLPRNYISVFPSPSRWFRGLFASIRKQLAKVFSKFLRFKSSTSVPRTVVK